MNKKIFLIFFLIGLLSLVFVSSSFAQEEERTLELEYPIVPGAPSLEATITLPGIAVYVFNLALMVGGLLAFIMIIIGGIRYLISA
ncbi:unnamed protein product, partial [marine sediment metagenome]